MNWGQPFCGVRDNDVIVVRKSIAKARRILGHCLTLELRLMLLEIAILFADHPIRIEAELFWLFRIA